MSIFASFVFFCALCVFCGANQAEAHHAEALRIREQHFGDDHEAVAQSAQFLSLLLQSAGTSPENDIEGVISKFWEEANLKLHSVHKQGTLQY